MFIFILFSCRKAFWHQLWLTSRGEIYVTVVYCCKMSISSPRRSLATLPRDHINGRCAGRWCICKVLTCLDLFILLSAHLLLSLLGRTLGMVTALLLRPSLSTGPYCRPTGCIHILVTKGKSQALVWKCVDQWYVFTYIYIYKIQVVPGQAGGGSFKFETLIAYRAEERLCP